MMNPNPKYTIAVLCEKLKDFTYWKADKNIKTRSEDQVFTFIRNEFRYIAVSSDERLRGTIINGVIQLPNFTHKKKYKEILNYLQYSMR